MQLQRPSLIQSQNLKMNPQLYQSLKIMEMPLAELRERIELELERNPALELLEDRGTVQLAGEDDGGHEARKEEYDYFESSFEHAAGTRYGGDAQADEHRRFIEGALTRPQTLQEHLLWQLQLEPVDSALRSCAATLIQNLDDDGFHKVPPAALFKPGDPVEKALALVRGLDPQGTACADYLESLKVQFVLTYGAKDAPAADKILSHLGLLQRGKFSALAKIVNEGENKEGVLDSDEIRLLYEDIKRLSPFPGRAFSRGEVSFVAPDVRIARDGGDFAIALNDETIPVLGINAFFEKLNGLPNGNAAKEFVKENIREARLFIQQLDRRNLTLLRVVKAVLDFQRPFFNEGPKKLIPLTLAHIAKELSMHRSTISRCASQKYLQCEWGIFELGYFFSNSASGAAASQPEGTLTTSKEGVKEIIKEIRAAEKTRLSDQDIADLLSRRGIALARRTVTKYRQELDAGGLPSRLSRKEKGRAGSSKIRTGGLENEHGN